MSNTNQRPPLPPPPPRRPPPAQLASSSSSTSPSMPTPTAGSSYTGSFLRARALAKVNKLAQSTSEFVGPRFDSAKETAAGKLNEYRERNASRDGSGTWGIEPGVQTSSNRAVPKVKDFADPVVAASEGSSTPGATTPRQKGWGEYLWGSPESRERKNSVRYTEEKVVCFPGWATLRPAAHSATEPALVLEIVAHGYAYRLRPVSQASRSQRVFYALAKSFAALPKIPPHLLPKGSLEEAAQSTETLDINVKEEALRNGNVFEQLLDIGGREGGRAEERELTEATILAQEPEEMTEEEALKSPTKKDFSTSHQKEDSLSDTESIVPGAAKVARRPRVATNVPPSLPARPSLTTRRSTVGPSPLKTSPVSRPSSLKSPTTSASSSRAPSRASSPTRQPDNKHQEDAWPKPFAYLEADLPRLHANLQARLLPFFGQKLAARKIRLSIYPSLEPGSLWDNPLATKIVSTSTGGAFKTSLEVRSKELRRLLDETGKGVESLERLRIRIVAELLEPEAVGDVLTGGFFAGGHQMLKSTAEDDSELVVAQDGGVRVISDIDDTVKWTEVLGGTKKIFRNVFVRDKSEIRVPGMASWYQQMRDEGAHFHYVSNSPWELWPVIREYLEASLFPHGSVTLKEYGGASSAIAKLWEEPGMRKRAGVESIIKEFKHSRFILIGDSGEQDLNLYVALAIEYPEQVLAIYIRDVTTPFNPDSHPNLSHLTSPSMSHSHSFSDLTSLNTPSTASGTASSASSIRSPTTQTISEAPELPSAYNPLPPSSSVRPSHSRQSSFLSHLPSKKKPLRSSTTSTASRPSSPPLEDKDVDPLSPNNPLRTSTLQPTQTEEQVALVEAFYARIVEAEKVLPEHVPLRLFRHGKECAKEGVEIVRKANGM